MTNIFKESLTTLYRNCGIWSEYHNPYHWWWKVRKYWKMPKIHLAHIGKRVWWFGLPICKDYYNKWFDIRISGLGCKNKHGEPRFEWDPYLSFTLLRKWQLVFIWNFCPHFLKKGDPTNSRLASEETWETILSMAAYDKKTVADACHDHGFYEHYHHCEDPDYYIPGTPITMFRNLTQYGWEQYYKIPRSKQLRKFKKGLNYEQGSF